MIGNAVKTLAARFDPAVSEPRLEARIRLVAGEEAHDAVVGSYACDGAGHCKPGSTKICVPFSCDPGTNDCVETCTTNSQCVSGQQCVSGSCGKKMKAHKADGGLRLEGEIRSLTARTRYRGDAR